MDGREAAARLECLLLGENKHIHVTKGPAPDAPEETLLCVRLGRAHVNVLLPSEVTDDGLEEAVETCVLELALALLDTYEPVGAQAS